PATLIRVQVVAKCQAQAPRRALIARLDGHRVHDCDSTQPAIDGLRKPHVTLSTLPDTAERMIASVTAQPCTISSTGMGNARRASAAFAKASRATRETSSVSACQISAAPLTGWNLQVPNRRVRRSSEDAPATWVTPSSRTQPFEPNT